MQRNFDYQSTPVRFDQSFQLLQKEFIVRERHGTAGIAHTNVREQPYPAIPIKRERSITLGIVVCVEFDSTGDNSFATHARLPPCDLRFWMVSAPETPRLAPDYTFISQR